MVFREHESFEFGIFGNVFLMMRRRRRRRRKRRRDTKYENLVLGC